MPKPNSKIRKSVVQSEYNLSLFLITTRYHQKHMTEQTGRCKWQIKKNTFMLVILEFEKKLHLRHRIQHLPTSISSIPKKSKYMSK